MLGLENEPHVGCSHEQAQAFLGLDTGSHLGQAELFAVGAVALWQCPDKLGKL